VESEGCRDEARQSEGGLLASKPEFVPSYGSARQPN